MKKSMNRDFPLSPTPSVSGDPIGPKTKKESRQSDRKEKITPPLSASGSAEMKAAKKKKVINTVAGIGGVIVGMVGKIARDARISRGAIRLGIDNSSSTNKQRWSAGKGRDTKSTKK